MPELPEVTTITNQLRKEIVGSTITGVVSVGGYKTTPEFQVFRQKVVGQKVVEVRRVAKNIVIGLIGEKESGLVLDSARTIVYSSSDRRESRSNIVIHLAMTGRLLLRQKGQNEDPWTRLIFKLEVRSMKYEVSKELRFCDSRMFGFVRLMNSKELEQYTSKYGPDALDESLTPQVFLAQLKKKRTEVKRAVLEQELIAGAGNIYVNDSLWMAKIHPQISTQDLTLPQSADLLLALQQILKEGIEHGGSTLGDKMYIDVYGREGEHQNYFRVFGRDGKECPRCRTIIDYIEIGGRGTFFCPKCQVRTVMGKKDTADKQPALL